MSGTLDPEKNVQYSRKAFMTHGCTAELTNNLKSSFGPSGVGIWGNTSS